MLKTHLWIAVTFSTDRGRPVLYLCHLLGRLSPGVRQGELRPPGPGRLEQPVNAQEADLWAAPRHQEGVFIQGVGRPHISLHHRGRGLQLGWRRLRQTGPRQQLHTEIPQTDPGAAAGEGTARLCPLTFSTHRCPSFLWTPAAPKTERVCAVCNSRWWCACLLDTGTAQLWARMESFTRGAKETLDD